MRYLSFLMQMAHLTLLDDACVQSHEKKPLLEVIVDVSCDPTSENNPINLKAYNRTTTFEAPILPLSYKCVTLVDFLLRHKLF